MLFVKVAEMVACFAHYVVDSWEGTLAYAACKDELPLYADPFECVLGWAIAEGTALAAYVTCVYS